MLSPSKTIDALQIVAINDNEATGKLSAMLNAGNTKKAWVPYKEGLYYDND